MSQSLRNRKGCEVNGNNGLVEDKNEVINKCDVDHRERQYNKKGETTRWTNVGTFIAIAVFVIYYSRMFAKQEEKIVVAMKKYSDIINQSVTGTRQYMATVDEIISDIRQMIYKRFHEVKCHENGYWREAGRGSAPNRCGTILSDTLVTEEEAQTLRTLAAKILDAIGYQSINYEESTNIKRIRLYELFVWGPQKNIFTENDFELINKASVNVKQTIADKFGIPYDKLYFAPVSEMTRFRPITKFREFRHIDKVRSAPLVVTSIIWLSTVGKDFEGGRVEFLTGGPQPFTPLLVEPKLGRFGAWTSGYENPHGVLELESGERLALLFAMTTDPEIGHKTMFDLKEYFVKQQNS